MVMNSLSTAEPELKKVELKPAAVSVDDACKYLGGISRAFFYRDYFDKVEIAQLGTRTVVLVDSLDRLLEDRKQRPRQSRA
jgi:hypothetical protein